MGSETGASLSGALVFESNIDRFRGVIVTRVFFYIRKIMTGLSNPVFLGNSGPMSPPDFIGTDGLNLYAAVQVLRKPLWGIGGGIKSNCELVFKGGRKGCASFT